VAGYLLAHFKTTEFLQEGARVMSGAVGQQRVPKNYVLNSLLPLAPLAEQQRIADKLDALLARVDACRARLDRGPLILKRFRQAVLAAATSGRLTEDWREERTNIAEWQSVDVQSVAAVGTGSTPLRSNPLFYAKEGIPWITSAATREPIIAQAQEFVTDAAVSAHRLTLYPVGTLLVAMYGEGKTRGQVSELAIEATINQACAAVKVDESKAVRGFVKLALQANYLEMRELAEGGNQPNLNLSKIKQFLLPYPSLEEQHEIVRRVEILFAYADRLEARVQAARTQVERLTPALLAKAFRGELVPQDPNDEPALALLERIRTARAVQPTKTKAGGSSRPSARQPGGQ
jgi:type I restriction enzyme S subunit